MVVARFPPHIGGAEMQAYHLARFLRARGLEVSVLTQHIDPACAPLEKMDGVVVYRLARWARGQPWESLAFLIEALRRLKKLDVHLVHAHMLSTPALVAAFARHLWKLPAIALGTGVGSIGEVGMSEGSLMRRVKFAFLKKHLDVVVCLVNLMKEELIREGFQEHQIRMIPNGVDLTRFRLCTTDEKEDLRRELKLPHGVPIAIYTGRISQEKGIDVLLKAWALTPKPSEALLVILGEGPDKQLLENRPASQVLWLGNVPRVQSHLRAADIFVLPSRGEALSNSLLEAMACGLPCIATDVGGTPEVIRNEHNGLLVLPENPESLSQALERLINDSHLRAAWGQEARKTVEEKFDLKQAARSYVQLYDELLQKSHDA